MEQVEEVGADSLEALPAVLRGKVGSCGVWLLCGQSGGHDSFRGGSFVLRGLAWFGFNRPHGFWSIDGFCLSWQVLNWLCLLGEASLGPGSQEGHLSLIWVLPAHMLAVDFGSLAGVLHLPQLPHHLGEVMARVGVVGTAQAGFALEVTVVRASCRLGWVSARHAQASVVPCSRCNHGARVFSLGAESDGLVPEAAWLLLAIVVSLRKRHTSSCSQE